MTEPAGHDDRSGDHPSSDRRRQLEALLGVPASEGNRVEVLFNGDQIFPAMLTAIDEAQHTVDLLTYVYWTGEPALKFASAICRAARRGVDARVLLDAVGSRDMDRTLIQDMQSAGATVEIFRPVSNPKFWETPHRTHRRVLVVDDHVGFTGGVGIAEEWLGDARDEHEWRETHCRIEGPAVNGLRAAFIDNWVETGHAMRRDNERFPQPEHAGDVPVMVVRGSAGVGTNDVYNLHRALIDVARERVRITTAYLKVQEKAVEAMRAAIERGVEVTVLLPGRHMDKRVAFAAAADDFVDLIEAGVDVRIYQRSMLHAKTITVDGQIGLVGSANFNSRSSKQDEEVAVVAFDAQVARALDDQWERDLEVSEPIDLERWNERSVARKVVEKVVSVAEELM